MTIGKDVSTLFQPVIKCLEHTDPELKKLVYLCKEPQLIINNW
jgi:AP-1 complex subunit beta-1